MMTQLPQELDTDSTMYYPPLDSEHNILAPEPHSAVSENDVATATLIRVESTHVSPCHQHPAASLEWLSSPGAW